MEFIVEEHFANICGTCGINRAANCEQSFGYCYECISHFENETHFNQMNQNDVCGCEKNYIDVGNGVLCNDCYTVLLKTCYFCREVCNCEKK